MQTHKHNHRLSQTYSMADMCHLPQEIVFDIFDRMPTKHFLRFRCLSKHWNRLISDHFMKSRSRRMFLLPFEPLQAIDNTLQGDHTIASLRYPFTNQGRVLIVGSFNGIVLLLVFKDMILYNPFTGSFKIVPVPPFDPSYIFNDAYGFCYGTTSDDLKIVRIRPNVRIYKCYLDSISCDVFYLKKGSWTTKTMKLVQKCFIDELIGTFFNGFLYWTAATKQDKSLIVTLDVKNMVFSEIQLPYNFRGIKKLCTIGGRLHVLHVDTLCYSFGLWVMNEHGIVKSWSNVWTSTSNIGLVRGYPMSILDDGKIVMLEMNKQRQVTIYDVLKGSYRKVYYDGANTSVGLNSGIQAMEYVESLISPSDLCSSLV